ncbi:MAG: hypothetical protein EOM62_11065 [Bacteroidia bacterium]|nr:hypothetical protein [Bacteroidia bacterium]
MAEKQKRMPHGKPCNILIYLLARPAGIEPLTKNLEGPSNARPTQLYKIYLFLSKLHADNKINFTLISWSKIGAIHY